MNHITYHIVSYRVFRNLLLKIFVYIEINVKFTHRKFTFCFGRQIRFLNRKVRRILSGVQEKEKMFKCSQKVFLPLAHTFPKGFAGFQGIYPTGKCASS